MMIKNIFSLLFFVVSFIMVRAMDMDFNEEERDLSNCSKTCSNNPCTAGGNQTFFEHCRRRMFIQCDESGGCTEQRCKKGTRWNQEFQACVHKRCGECRNNCKSKNVDAGELFSKHCNDKTKFRQCDALGGCFEMECPPGTVWKQKKNACV
mmetsp:Transcript_29824/g.43580  ORF Transcript_29824/g.43580 Transcript_29824/m.43580 type:complete len:151 (-) Transcript_29824:252-704(-)